MAFKMLETYSYEMGRLGMEARNDIAGVSSHWGIDGMAGLWERNEMDAGRKAILGGPQNMRYTGPYTSDKIISCILGTRTGQG